jgi:SAM-dependent methyltransferase
MNREFEVEELSNCPVCSNDNLKYIMTGYDDRFSQPDEFDVVECQVCGLGFLKQLICAEELPKLYNKYYWREDSSQSSQQLAEIKTQAISYFIKILRKTLDYPSRINIGRLISPGKSVLEIGCGPASRAEDYINQGLRWTGLEIDYRMCEKIRARGLTCIHGTIEDMVVADDCRFDAIIGSQVLEHIVKPRPFLRACARVLKPAGQLIFSIPNYDAPWRKRAGHKWLNWHIPYHRFYYNRRSLGYLAQIEGFRITRCRLRTPFHWVMLQRHMITSYPERGRKNKEFYRSYNSYDKILAIIESWKQLALQTGEALIVEMRRS